MFHAVVHVCTHTSKPVTMLSKFLSHTRPAEPAFVSQVLTMVGINTFIVKRKWNRLSIETR